MLFYTDPKITLTEYLIYVFSSFGIWFGLSIYSMNPLRLLSMKVRRCLQPGSRRSTAEGDEDPAALVQSRRQREWSYKWRFSRLTVSLEGERSDEPRCLSDRSRQVDESGHIMLGCL